MNADNVDHVGSSIISISASLAYRGIGTARIPATSTRVYNIRRHSTVSNVHLHGRMAMGETRIWCRLRGSSSIEVPDGQYPILTDDPFPNLLGQTALHRHSFGKYTVSSSL